MGNRHWSDDRFNRRLVRMRELEWELVRPLLEERPRGRFLDVGCGTGYLMGRVQELGYEVFGIDPAAGQFGVQGVASTAPIIKARAESIPFPDGHFDVVYSSHALMFMENRDAALAEMARIVKTGGVVILVNTTRAMALLRIFSWWIFNTPRRLLAALRPGRGWPQHLFMPPPRVPGRASAWAELPDFSMAGFRALAQRHLRISRVVYGWWMPWADWPPLFPPVKLGRLCSSFVAVCHKPEEGSP